MQKSKELFLNKFYILLAISFFANKMIFNESGSPQGGFNANISIYLNAVVTVFFTFSAFILQKRLFNLVTYTPFTLVYLFYLFALLTTVFSGIKVITIYNSFLGVFYVFFSQAILKSIVAKFNSETDIFKCFYTLVLTTAVTMAITAIAFELIYLKNYTFLITGVGADFSAMLFLYCFISKFIVKKSVYNLTILFIVAAFSIKLNSFSSYLSILIGLLVYLVLTGRIVIVSILLFIFISLVVGGITFLSNNLDLVINNKPAAAYLSGSGRFAYYLEAINVIVNEFSNIQLLLGRGFMAERVYMEGRGLYWITDPHSSALTSMMGAGLLGLLLHFYFLIYPFIYYYKKKSIINKLEQVKIVQLLLVFHSMACAYGMTSSYYLGRPSFLLIIGLVALGLMITIIKYYEEHE